MWLLTLFGCGAGLATDLVSVLTTAVVARHLRKNSSPHTLAEHTEVLGQSGPHSQPENHLQSEGLPLFAQLLALGLCLLGFNSLFAEPQCLLAQLADLVQALAWGVMLLVASWSYHCQLEAPDLSPSHPGRQPSLNMPLQLSLVETQRLALNHQTGEGVQRYPLAHSFPLLLLWALRAAASWVRSAESLTRISGHSSALAKDFICAATAMLATLFALATAGIRLWRWHLSRRSGRRTLDRLYSACQPALEHATSFGAWAALRAPPPGSRYILNKKVLEGSGLLNHLWFSWVTPLMKRGTEGPLTLSDLFRLPRNLRPQVCANRLWDSWCRERRRARALGKEHKPRFLRACVVAFSGPLARLGILKAMTVGLSFAGPLLLKALLKLLIEEVGPEGNLNPSAVRSGFFLVSTLTGSCLAMAILQTQCVYQQGRICCQLRAALTSCLYRKALCINKAELKPAALGDAKSICSTHVEELVALFSYFHDAWSIPLTILIGLVILYHQVRFAGFPGLLLVAMVVWANRFLAKRMKDATEKLSAIRENRICTMAEVLQNIPHIKVSALEDIFFRKVSRPRCDELRYVRQGHRLNALRTFLTDSGSGLFTASILATYALMGGKMRADIVFTCLALFHVINQPINNLPWTIVSWRRALSCTRKLRCFMSAEETASAWAYRHQQGEPNFSGWTLLFPQGKVPQLWQNAPEEPPSAMQTRQVARLLRRGHGMFHAHRAPKTQASAPLLGETSTLEYQIDVSEAGVPEDVSIFLQAASFTPTSDQKGPPMQGIERCADAGGVFLQGLDLKVQTGGLCCVLGGTESGKSRLLEALRGELCCVEGWGAIRGSISCAMLDPFLMPGSFRDNILFGEPFEAARYGQVIGACQLASHLRLLPQNDETIISNSSSPALTDTAKAKLSLARAVYKVADVYLFDDVWHALDVEAAQSLASSVLQGDLVSGKTCLIATDLYNIVQAADQVVWMQDRCINEAGEPAPFLQDTAAMSGSEGAALSKALKQIKSTQKTRRREASAQDLVELLLKAPDKATGAGVSRSSSETSFAEASSASFGDIVGPHFTTSGMVAASLAASHSSGSSSLASSPSSPASPMRSLRSPSRLNRNSSDKELPDPGGEIRAEAVLAGKFPVEPPPQLAGLEAGPPGDLQASVVSFTSSMDPPGDPGGSVSPFLSFAGREGTDGASTSMSFCPSSALGVESGNSRSSDSSSPRALTALQIEHEADGSLKIIDESREDCNVSSSTYVAYFHASGVRWVAMGILSTAIMLGAHTALDLWIAAWVTYSHDQDERHIADGKEIAGPPTPAFGQLKPIYRLDGLLVIAAVVVALTAARSWAFCELAQSAARQMHERMLKTTIGMPLSFFTTMPLSRILGRFSTDVAAVDETLPKSFNLLVSKLAKCLSISAVLVFVEPWLLFGLIPVAVALYCLQRTYHPSSMEVMRLAAASLSYSSAQGMEAIEGGPAIRAQGVQEVFQLQQYLVTGDVQRSAMAQLAVSQWLAIRLKVAAALIAGAVGAIAITDVSDILPRQINWHVTIGLIGLSLTYTLPAAELLGSLLASSMDTAQGMMSAERMSEFASLVSEQELDRIHIRSTIPRFQPGKRPTITPGMLARKSPEWPRHGEVLFENVTLHYENSFTPALDHLTLAIPAGTKVGIVGRTAAGKSSLLGALLRMWPLSGGTIRIDGLDVREIPVRRLRFVVDVLPQQPFLFQGSVRENIDPYSRFSDDAVKAALQTVQLWDTLQSLAASLPANPALPAAISDREARPGDSSGQQEGHQTQEPIGHSVISVADSLQPSIADSGVLTAPIIGLGRLTPHQAQLLALVRILLRAPRIVCLDEATASVDPHTASLMSKAMRAYLARSTCLQVAHSLDDVMSCSSVVVMAAGRVVERGDPNLLLKNPKSHFAVLHSYNAHHNQHTPSSRSNVSRQNH